MTSAPIVFVGPFPPPVHGQSECTRFIYEHLSEASLDLVKIDTAGVHGHGKPVEILTRVLVHLRAAFVIVRTGVMARSPGTVYVSINSNMGMYLSAFLALVGRLSGSRLVFHHHAFAHIRQRKPAMWLLTTLAGPAATHVTLCEAMGMELGRRYPTARRGVPLSNAVLLLTQPSGERRPGTELRLGHLGNLRRDKGLDVCIDLAKSLRKDGLDVKLIVAGPPADADARQLLAEAREALDDAFCHRGPVYGSDKERFFRDIDVFIFPSRYKNESQPIVIMEALASSVPVLAFGQCCIASDLADSGGMAVPVGENFVETAGKLVAKWMSDPGAFIAASRQAAERYRTLKREGARQLERFTELMTAEREPHRAGKDRKKK